MEVHEDIEPPALRQLLHGMTVLEGERPTIEEVHRTLLQVAQQLTDDGQVAHCLQPMWCKT